MKTNENIFNSISALLSFLVLYTSDFAKAKQKTSRRNGNKRYASNNMYHTYWGKTVNKTDQERTHKHTHTNTHCKIIYTEINSICICEYMKNIWNAQTIVKSMNEWECYKAKTYKDVHIVLLIHLFIVIVVWISHWRERFVHLIDRKFILYHVHHLKEAFQFFLYFILFLFIHQNIWLLFS